MQTSSYSCGCIGSKARRTDFDLLAWLTGDCTSMPLGNVLAEMGLCYAKLRQPTCKNCPTILWQEEEGISVFSIKNAAYSAYTFETDYKWCNDHRSKRKYQMDSLESNAVRWQGNERSNPLQGAAIRNTTQQPKITGWKSLCAGEMRTESRINQGTKDMKGANCKRSTESWRGRAKQEQPRTLMPQQHSNEADLADLTCFTGISFGFKADINIAINITCSTSVAVLCGSLRRGLRHLLLWHIMNCNNNNYYSLGL